MKSAFASLLAALTLIVAACGSGGSDTATKAPGQPTSAPTARPSTAQPSAPPVSGVKLTTTPLVTKPLQPSTSDQQVSWNDQITVTVPGGLLQSNQPLTISSVSNAPAHPSKGAKELATYDVALGAETQLGGLLTVQIAFDPAKVASDLPLARALFVGYWDSVGQTWQFAPAKIDTQKNLVTIKTDHLTPWRLYYWARGYEILETDHFVTVYDPKGPTPTVSKEPTDIKAYASDVAAYLEGAYKKYAAAGYYMDHLNWAVVAPRAMSKRTGALSAFATQIGFDPEFKTMVFLDKDTTESYKHKLSGNIYVALSQDSQEKMRNELAHELFHAVQNGYYTLFGMNARRWWIEATADYAAATVVTGNFGVVEKPDWGYFDKSLRTVDDFHEYASAYFIRYLVDKKGYNFKELWDLPTGSLDILLPVEDAGLVTQELDRYAKKKGTSLQRLFRDYAEYLYFDSASPLFPPPASLIGKKLADASAPALFKLTDKELPFTFKVTNFTTKLWGFKVETKDATTKRALTLQLPTTFDGRPDDSVSVCAYVLKNDQRLDGGAKGDCVVVYTEPQSLSITAGRDDTVYILAVYVVPAGTQTINIPAKVSEAAATTAQGIINNRTSEFGSADNPLTVRLAGTITGDPGLRFEGTEFYSRYAGKDNVLAFVYSIPANAAKDSLDFDGVTLQFLAPAKTVVAVRGTQPQVNNADGTALTIDQTFTWIGGSGGNWTGRPARLGADGSYLAWNGDPVTCRNCVLVEATRAGEGTAWSAAGGAVFVLNGKVAWLGQYRNMQTGVLGSKQVQDRSASQNVVIRLVKR